MATKFLDCIGLSYFWGKIKAWCNATFAAITHNQASNTINAMTGYNKPSSGSAIAASDSLNSAIGKLEAKVDAIDDSSYVHKTGNEIISGIKTFNGLLHTGSNNGEAYGLIIRDPNIDLSQTSILSNGHYWSIAFCDATGSEWTSDADHGRIGILESGLRTNNTVYTRIAAYKRITGEDSIHNTEIVVGKDSNDIDYATCPSTSENRSYGLDIITRDWIPKDTRIVHTTEDETISGIKYFNNTMRTGMSLQYRNSTLTRGTTPSEDKYYTLAFYDKDGYAISNRFGLFETTVLSDGRVMTTINAYRNIANTNTIASIGVVAQENGSLYAWAPSTNVNRTAGNDIVTRDFIPQDTRIVHTTGNETISGQKTFSNTITLKGDYTTVRRMTNNYAADQLPGTLEWIGGFTWHDKNGRFIASIEPYISTTYLDYNLFMTGCASTASFQSGLVLSMKHGGGEEVLRPRYNNQMTLGNSTFRWKQLYAVTATISTSDERLKSNIGIISEDVLDAWEDVDWVQFQFKDAIAEKGIGARLHTGLVAQHIIDIFSKHNLDRNHYAFFCYDSWDAIPEKLDKDGNVLDKAIPAGDVYSIRYEEALCVEAAYQRRKNKILENRISELERQVSDMLQILQSLKGAN